jgi:hypothetical protein
MAGWIAPCREGKWHPKAELAFLNTEDTSNNLIVPEKNSFPIEESILKR